MKKIRIDLNEENIVVENIAANDNSGENGGENGGDTSDAVGIDSLRETVNAVQFGLSRQEVSGYSFSRYSYPVTNIDITVPSGDTETVKGWLDGTSASVLPAPGDTLVKRMTENVIGAADTFMSAAGREGLITAPVKVMLAVRYADGKTEVISGPVTLLPNRQPPVIAIGEHIMLGDMLMTRSEIITEASRIVMTLPAFAIPETPTPIRSLLILSTEPTPLFNGDEKVTAIRSQSLYGEVMKCWYYPRMAEALILSATEAATKYRVIDEIAIEEASQGFETMAVPRGAADLSDWSGFETVRVSPGAGENESDGNSGGESGPTAGGQRHLRLTTGALDLGDYEGRKVVRGLSVRGVFDRLKTGDEPGVSVKLYGSHHRESWHEVARAKGANLRLIRSFRYRWWKIEIEARLRVGDILESVIVEVG